MIGFDRLTRRRAETTAPDAKLLIDRAAGVPKVSDWLRRHPDGGWSRDGEGPRADAARHLLFLMYLFSNDRISEWRRSDGL